MRCTSWSRKTRFAVASSRVRSSSRRARPSLRGRPATAPGPAGLELAHEPRPHVGEALVVEVHGVLGGEHHPDTLGPGLLEQREQRPLGGRIGGMGREVAEDLVHVDEGPQLGGARLLAHPRLHLVQEKAVTNSRSSSDRCAVYTMLSRGRPSGRGAALDVQGLALAPGRERRGGQQVVEGHHQALALLAREDGLQGQRAQLVERRVRHPGTRASRLWPLPARQECSMRSTGRWTRSTAGDRHRCNEAEQAGHEARDLVAQVFRRGIEGDRGRLEGLQDVQGTTPSKPGVR